MKTCPPALRGVSRVPGETDSKEWLFIPRTWDDGLFAVTGDGRAQKIVNQTVRGLAPGAIRCLLT